MKEKRRQQATAGKIPLRYGHHNAGMVSQSVVGALHKFEKNHPVSLNSHNVDRGIALNG